MSKRGAREFCLSRGRPPPRGRGGAATKHRGGGALPHQGGFGDMRLQALRHTSTPTDNRILANHIYEFLTLGTGAMATEQL